MEVCFRSSWKNTWGEKNESHPGYGENTNDMKDGELVRMRAQHTTDNIELASTFQNIAIHEEEPKE